jgi:hypothetical protein
MSSAINHGNGHCCPGPHCSPYAERLVVESINSPRKQRFPWSIQFASEVLQALARFMHKQEWSRMLVLEFF